MCCVTLLLTCVSRGYLSSTTVSCSLGKQWCTEGGGSGVQIPPKFRSFNKAEPNSQFRGKYIRNNLIRIRVSLICKLSGTLD
jgi:hypothetical protein